MKRAMFFLLIGLFPFLAAASNNTEIAKKYNYVQAIGMLRGVIAQAEICKRLYPETALEITASLAKWKSVNEPYSESAYRRFLSDIALEADSQAMLANVINRIRAVEQEMIRFAMEESQHQSELCSGFSTELLSAYDLSKYK